MNFLPLSGDFADIAVADPDTGQDEFLRPHGEFLSFILIVVVFDWSQRFGVWLDTERHLEEISYMS